MPNLSKDEIAEVADWFDSIKDYRQWLLFQRLMKEKVNELQRSIMSDATERTFDRGRFVGMNDVLDKPNQLINQFITSSDTETR